MASVVLGEQLNTEFEAFSFVKWAQITPQGLTWGLNALTCLEAFNAYPLVVGISEAGQYRHILSLNSLSPVKERTRCLIFEEPEGRAHLIILKLTIGRTRCWSAE